MKKANQTHRTNHLLKALLLSVFLPVFSQAEVVVIVSANNPNSELDEKQIYNIYMGKSKSFPDGSKALPLDQKKGSKSRDSFRDGILQKSSSQLNTYWSRLIFTGKGTPPQEGGDSASVKAMIAKNPNLIGYIEADHADDSVKILYSL